MIVCICNAYRSSDIARVACDRGLRDPVSVYRAMGAGPRCCMCLESAQDFIDEAHETALPRMMAAE